MRFSMSVRKGKRIARVQTSRTCERKTCERKKTARARHSRTVALDHLRFMATAIGCLIGAIVIAAASPSVAQWRVIPEIRVTGGDETDLVIDPGVTRVVVPGGPFAELTPRLSARTWIGRGAILDFGTFATFQRFLNDESRLLYAQTVWGDVYQNFGRAFRGRLSGAFDYYDDSERDDVRRFGYGAEAGISLVRPLWNAELWGAAYGRRYPNLTVTDMGNQTSTYTETTWSGAGTLRIAPTGRVSVRTDGILQTTDALDPYYDSQSWTASGSIDARVVSSLFLTLSGTYQNREFTARPTSGDQDKYLQAGVGLRYSIGTGWTALVRWAFSNYTWPDGSDEDSYRLSVGVNYAWGRRDAPPPQRVDIDMLTRESKGAVQKPDREGTVLFRIEAPAAAKVSVVGSFNGWESGATALAKTGDEWWEVRIELAPGSYEYAYVVDGEWTTPPEALVTVEDGFGGRNGVLEVLPPEI
jgi:hypothetical protein